MNMLRRRKREPMRVREPERIDCPGHLAWVRGHCCAIEGKADHICQGKMEAHHVREGQAAGMGRKPDDSEAVPLCALAHRTGHDMGWASFKLKYGVDLVALAAMLWAKSPHRLRYQKKQQERSA